MPDDKLPLRGLTVVEFSTSVAAPFAGQVLADLGARVMKVENPEHGDDARNWGPPFADNGMSPVFNSFNRNKQSLAVNLKDEAERGKLRDFIVRHADIVLQNLRPGLLASLGFDGKSLRADAPKLIWCDMHAFGAQGPKKMQPGYDPLMQACGGIMSITGLEGQEPIRVGPSIVDQGTGMWAVIGILAALRERELTGEGSEVSTSLYETAIGWVPVQIATYFLNGKVPRKFGTENFGYAPCKAYEAKGGWLMLAAGNDRLYRKLTDVIGDADFANDPDFASNPQRVENREKLNARLQDLIGRGDRDDWVARLNAVGVPAAPVLSLDEVVADPQFDAVEMEQTLPEDDMRLIGVPLTFDGVRPPLRHGPPALGDATHLLDEDEDNRKEAAQ
ncbi:CoA transferase [Oricola sp.]|uniref:CaiB/BaiF CoA transferase family protein n=1 Tax=Oricola sp. TaxID=1979950 RepID=UPI0025F2BC11|nr:CoA transferase [Oricola sp.]MCI5074136.1 CoA transferase [Oricola sp.]